MPDDKQQPSKIVRLSDLNTMLEAVEKTENFNFIDRMVAQAEAKAIIQKSGSKLYGGLYKSKDGWCMDSKYITDALAEFESKVDPKNTALVAEVKKVDAAIIQAIADCKDRSGEKLTRPKALKM